MASDAAIRSFSEKLDELIHDGLSSDRKEEIMKLVAEKLSNSGKIAELSDPAHPEKVAAKTSSTSRRKRLGIIGFGNFGQFLAKRLLSEYDVFAQSRSDYSQEAPAMGVAWHASMDSLIAQDLDILIVATSILSFEEVVQHLSDSLVASSVQSESCADILIVDVLSVK